MSKHEQRASHQSQLKLKVKGKRFSCPNGANRRASGAKIATTITGHRKWREQACFSTFSSWRQISNSNRMRNICRNGARSEADLAQCGALALPPPFLFLWLLVQFFFSTAPCYARGAVYRQTQHPCPCCGGTQHPLVVFAATYLKYRRYRLHACHWSGTFFSV